MDRAFSDSKLVIGNMALFSPFDIYTLIGVVIIVGGLGLFFGRTRMGLRLRSSAFAPEVSRLLGVNVQRMRTLGWGLAAAVGGLTTLFVVPRNVGLTPNVMDGVFISSFTAAVIGGLDSPEGAVIGGLLTGLTLAYVTGYVPAGASLGNVAVMLLLLVVLLVRPGGLFSGVAARRV
jgi:branched-chain amino acid transport system permease protein